jgi:hypothetical protein
MLRTFAAICVSVLLTGASIALAADPVPAAGEVAEPRDATPGEARVYGPVLAKDPLVRAQIKRLYVEQHRLHEETFEQLDQLNAELASETDPDFRYEINARIADLKIGLEARNMELGLEIAQLNGDTERAAVFERALDQLRHPEDYRNETSVQPSAELDAALRDRQGNQ